jgi:hypothetical protein
MNHKYAFSYIIGYRHRPDRLAQLRRVLDWLNAFSSIQIILVEQDKHSKISHLNLKAKHVFVKSNMPYNRSWAFNVGLKYVNSDIVVCGDSDLIMRPEDLIEGLKAVSQFDVVNPYHSVIDLTPQESQIPLEQIMTINRPGRGELDHQKTNICGGICIFRKDALYKIAGWNENFIGWGGEDDYQAIKVENFLTWTTINHRCYHLYHNRESLDQVQYQKTLNLLSQLKSLSKDDLVKNIQREMQKMGMRNKYDNF